MLVSSFFLLENFNKVSIISFFFVLAELTFDDSWSRWGGKGMTNIEYQARIFSFCLNDLLSSFEMQNKASRDCTITTTCNLFAIHWNYVYCQGYLP